MELKEARELSNLWRFQNLTRGTTDIPISATAEALITLDDRITELEKEIKFKKC
ncbi:hypothetical protein LCGC14_2118390 [marine sediment metagenome]|uniref:Uncharacterized protein n=1 Tax=marine sediment metagenome TaxID=412755 RepID=A0A0F9H199_9ZZZZ